MDIIVVTDTEAVKEYFKPIQKSKTYSIRICSCADMKEELRRKVHEFLLYVDINGFTAEKRDQTLKYLSKIRGLVYGIIDGRGVLKDPASLFHSGASDYLGKDMKQIDTRRLRQVTAFASVKEGPAQEGNRRRASLVECCIPSGEDWRGVKTGQEYTFYLMFAELDNQTALKNQFSDIQLNIAVNKFKNFIERMVASEHGRIWMWNEFGGLILFPYSGLSFGAVMACMRIILSRKLFSVEELNFKKLVSYRIALHIGNTVYRKRGDTGTIISSSINTIFHLGKKYVKPGNFYITANVYRNLSQKVKKTFRAAGSFEGHEIMRMRLPV